MVMLNQRGSSHPEFWNLLSKKLSNEATSEELAELQSVLLHNPDLHHQADMLTEMWQQGITTKSVGSEAAYMRHIMKHKDEIFVEENSVENNSGNIVMEDNPGFSRSVFKRRTIILSF